MAWPFVWYDVFTDRRHAGNALAVFPDAGAIPEAAFASIARELNLSETTFVLPPDRPDTTHRVRIFTPGRELAFAGHPTVGTAVAIAERAGTDEVDLVLGLGAGPTPVHVRRGADGISRATFVAPQLPRLAPSPIDVSTATVLVGLDEGDADPGIPVHVIDAGGTTFVVIAVSDIDVLGRAHPAGARTDVVGVYVVARVGSSSWRARMFAPGVGVPEDPATGSAACAFAGTLHRHVAGGGADGVHDVVIDQGIEMGRASHLELSYTVAAGAIEEVRLTGAAVKVLDGSYGATVSPE